MKLTTYQSEKNLNLLAPYIDILKELGYGELNFDAVYKWSTIMFNVEEAAKKLNRKLRILDIGGGLGPLDQIFTKYGTVVSIDIKNDRSTWFPVSENSFYKDSSGFDYQLENLERVCVDFWKIEKLFEHESFDVVYDSCSMIHFSNYGRENDTPLSVFKASRIVHNLLKSDGFFIVASDVATPRTYEHMDMIFGQNLDLAITSAGFCSTEEFSDDLKITWTPKVRYSDALPGYLSRGTKALNPGDSACALISHKYKMGRAKVSIEVVQSVYRKSETRDSTFEANWKNIVHKPTAINSIVRYVNWYSLAIKSKFFKQNKNTEGCC